MYVVSQSVLCGLIAGLAPVGLPSADIVVTDDVAERLCAAQVNTPCSTQMIGSLTAFWQNGSFWAAQL